MMAKLALSHSRLSDFEQCPRKFYLKYIEKSFPDESDNPNFVRGNNIHKQLENYLTWKTVGQTKMEPPKLSPESVNVVPIIDNLVAKMDVVMGEQQIATDFNWNKCGWFGGDVVKYRCILDLVGLKSDMAAIVDYKTGKVRDYSGWGGQLHLNSAVIMSIYPEVQKVNCAYLYVDHKVTKPITVTRAELPQLQGHFDSKHERVANETKFDPKINEFCKWCPATKKQCHFSKQL
jgi:CRISPR/Cas system-associated exonuclease Cas4 (RecB family)